VEVGDGNRRLVAVADRERRARDGDGDAERSACTAHERRLPGAELTGDGDDVTAVEAGGEAAGERCGLLRRGGDDRVLHGWSVPSEEAELRLRLRRRLPHRL